MTITEYRTHVSTYRRFVTAVRFVILFLIMGGTVACYSFFTRGDWPGGVVLVLVELAAGYYFIVHHLPIVEAVPPRE